MTHRTLLSDTIAQLTDALQPDGAVVTATGLNGSMPACCIADLALTLQHPCIVLTADCDSGEEMLAELRFYSSQPEKIFWFPPWETAPFEQRSPHPDVSGARLQTLLALHERRAAVIVMPITALLQKVLPEAALSRYCRLLRVGEEVDREAVLRQLMDLGYSMVPLVEDRGTASVRGGIVDIFPPNLPLPVRIELFGDFIESLRCFDPMSQRSLHGIDAFMLMPSREIILAEDIIRNGAPRLKERCDELGVTASRRRDLLEQMHHGIYPPGVDYLQPLFHESLATLIDYAGPSTVLVEVDPLAIAAAAEHFLAEVAAGESRAQAEKAIICAGNQLFLDMDGLNAVREKYRRISLPRLVLAEDNASATLLSLTSESNDDLRITVSPESEGVLRPLAERCRAWLDAKARVVFVCHQHSQVQRLHDLLAHYQVPLTVVDTAFADCLPVTEKSVALVQGTLSRGFRFPEQGLVVIAEEEVFGKRTKRRDITDLRKKQILVSLEELKPGDFMVHVDCGVGIYRGLQHLVFDGIGGDFLLLEYAGNDRLYLPVDRINLVQRYVGAETLQPVLDKLGGVGWDKKKAKAREAIEEMAEELLRIYAARQVHEGVAFTPPDDVYREFEASFAFEETPDQLSAIEDVIRDMERSRPMDRLVCGDVGYGKTEVAMRGAFKAAMDGKQVAVLVPTTVLAQQHLESFRKRMAAYPIVVEMLSRFRTPREQKAILQRVKSGEVDIIIGTHRLLQNDVAFKDLGLVIIDEEHRFGVSHKEKLKKFRSVVDVLTLTATPIPRTLNMSLAGIRDLSIIDTPPVDRLAIKTFVGRFSDDLIREAVLRELRRGGQVFFVHNRVQSIAAMAEYLRNLVPEAKLAIGHGQMQEKELEEVMLGFMHGEYNLFLCTTIIESGLDIPSANTMIVNRADTFGLAQLYQLRGRVGRSSQRAYAYFLIPGEGSISADARERLRVIQELTELGAGFRIAIHDLEIRGAGDFLGSRQSGTIAAVGFELYNELLEEAVATLRGEGPVERIEPEINLKVPAFIPEDYVADANQRLVLYKRLAQSSDDGDVDVVGDELIDRFGPLPQQVSYLLESMKLRVMLRTFMVKRLEFDGARLLFAFHEKTPVSPDTVIGLINTEPGRFCFTPDFIMTAQVDDASCEGVLAAARNVLKRLI